MNSFILFFKEKLISRILGVFTIIGGLTSIFTNFSIEITAIIVLAFVVLLLIFYIAFLQKKISELGQRSIKVPIVEAFRDFWPEAIKIGEWVSSTIFSSDAIDVLSEANKSFSLKKYTKNFVISDSNITINQEFKGKNNSVKSVDHVSLASISGSSQQVQAMNLQLNQEQNGKTYSIVNTVEYVNERLTKIKVHFATPISPFGDFKINSREIKKNSMWQGMDAVFYTPVSYFSGGTELLQSDMVFKEKILSIGAYFYDIPNNKITTCKEQPAEIEENHYSLHIEKPNSEYLYFIVFFRESSENRE